MPTSVSLRDRQRQLARQALIDAAAEVLMSGDPDSVSLSELAGRAGVSDRTLYRYFESRDDVMLAAAQHLVTTLGLAPPIDPADIPGSFRASAERMAARPKLVANMQRTSAGRKTRNEHRHRRAGEVAEAVAAQAPEGAEQSAVEAAGAVVALLCSSVSWTTIADESDLPVERAHDAVAWALVTLMDAVRAGQLPDPTENHEKQEHHEQQESQEEH